LTSPDELVFDATERNPIEDLKLGFKLIQGMSEEDQKTLSR
jgi:hypothetical protein